MYQLSWRSVNSEVGVPKIGMICWYESSDRMVSYKQRSIKGDSDCEKVRGRIHPSATFLRRALEGLV
jgi:hypothetical protein